MLREEVINILLEARLTEARKKKSAEPDLFTPPAPEAAPTPKPAAKPTKTTAPEKTAADSSKTKSKPSSVGIEPPLFVPTSPEELKTVAMSGDTEEVPFREYRPPRKEEKPLIDPKVKAGVIKFIQRLRDPQGWKDLERGYEAGALGTPKQIGSHLKKLKSEKESLLNDLHTVHLTGSPKEKEIHGIESFVEPEEIRGQTDDDSIRKRKRALENHILNTDPDHVITQLSKHIDDATRAAFTRKERGGLRLKLGRAAGALMRGYLASPLERSSADEGSAQTLGRYLRAKKVFGRGSGYGSDGFGLPSLPGISKPGGAGEERGRRID
jgi:hypothetical protein